MNRRHMLIVCGVLSWACLSHTPVSRAEEAMSPFESEVFMAADGKTLPYRLLRPEVIEAGKSYPLVLFFHGAGERGDDNLAQLKHVCGELATPELRQRFPAFVIAPQCPLKKQWVDTPWTADSHTMPEQPSETMAIALELLAQARQTLPIDPQRIYLVGLSMGGYGTWDLLQRTPQTFAAALPICGGGDPAFVAGMKEIPIWAFHGDADTVVKVKRSREMVNKLREIGAHPIYTEYPGVAHNSWTVTGQNRLVWDWLFAQSR